VKIYQNARKTIVIVCYLLGCNYLQLTL